MKVSYFFSTWSGNRRQGISHGNFTFQHLQCLGAVAHNVSNIIIGWPYNPNESQQYQDYMESLNHSVVRTPNIGLSYGQFNEAVKQHPDFDYIIFTEDDYVPVLDNFDQALVEEFNKRECGYLCGHAARLGRQITPTPTEGIHAAITWGIFSRESLSLVQEHNNGNIYCHGEGSEQVAFSNTIKEHCAIDGLTDKYTVKFNRHLHGIEVFGSGPEMFSPIEAINGLQSPFHVS